MDTANGTEILLNEMALIVSAVFETYQTWKRHRPRSHGARARTR